MGLFRRKKKDKDKELPEWGTFKHAIGAGVKDPREFYRMRLEYLKNKKEAKRIRRKEKEGKL
jgi:hypothetical protein